MSDASHPLFALIHSPLTGPTAWQPVADYLWAWGHRVIAPDLSDTPGTAEPYWSQHVAAAVSAISRATAQGTYSVVLVAHSGAGPLLGAMGAALNVAPTAYVFADAGLPPDSPATRLDLIRAEGGEWVTEFERFLRDGGRFPNWTDDDLREELPDPPAREGVLADLRPRGLDYFNEPLPRTPDVATLPGAYLHFTAAYDIHAAQATRWGWPVARQRGGHFAPVADPERTTAALLALASAAAQRTAG
jgi:hypothetical protein